MLNVELELKAEKENAEVRVTNVKDYQVCTLIQDHIRAIEKVQNIFVLGRCRRRVGHSVRKVGADPCIRCPDCSLQIANWRRCHPILCR